MRSWRPRTRRFRRRASALAAAALAAVLAMTPWAPAQADSVRAASWQLPALDVPAAQRLAQGQYITVAVIDTGVDATHPDLRGNVLTGVDTWDVDNGSNGWRDTVGHGTAMASLIAGHGHGPRNADGVLGLAPRAKILPINVQRPGSPLINPDDIAAGIEYAVQRGARVVCVALTGSYSARQVEAVNAAESQGVLVVAAAGNKSDGVLMGSPANIRASITVTSLDRNGRLAASAVTGESVDLSAPGERIPAAVPGGGYETVGGSSPAAAVVAGAVALILDRYPPESASMTKQRLAWNTRDLGVKGWDEQYGWGALNLVASLTRPPEQRAVPTVLPSPTVAASEPRASSGIPGAVYTAALGLGCLVVVAGAVAGVVIALRRRRSRRGLPPPPEGSPGMAPVSVAGSTAGSPGAGPTTAGRPGAASTTAGTPGAGSTAGSLPAEDVWRRPADGDGQRPPPASGGPDAGRSGR